MGERRFTDKFLDQLTDAALELFRDKETYASAVDPNEAYDPFTAANDAMSSANVSGEQAEAKYRRRYRALTTDIEALGYDSDYLYGTIRPTGDRLEAMVVAQMQKKDATIWDETKRRMAVYTPQELR